MTNTTTDTILDKILATKHQEVAQRRQHKPLEALRNEWAQQPPCRGFTDALLIAHRANQPAIIAEIKRASPSKGLIREDFDPPAHAKSYASAGASCLSVLTDEQYFQGHDDYLRQARAAVDLPILRKDFVVDDYQIHEARAMGADCILLIVAALDIMQLTTLYQCATNLNIDVLLEVHNTSELNAALTFNPKLIGINNRNLKTFETSIQTTIDLLPKIPDGVMVVTESGISTRDAVTNLRSHNINGFLVGEAFMRAADPGVALQELFFPTS